MHPDQQAKGEEVTPDQPFTRAFEGRSVVLHGYRQDFAKALEGDGEAIGRIYGVAGALIRAGRPIPEPVATFIADRMHDICQVLVSPASKGVRDGLPQAVAPNPRGMRDVGRRDSSGLTAIAQTVIDLCSLPGRKRGFKKALIAGLAQEQGYKASSIEREITRLNDQKSNASKPD